MLASHLPVVKMSDPKIKGRDDEYTIEVEVENQGYLPTALRQAQLVKIVQPDRITLEFPRDVLPPRRLGRGRFGRFDESREPQVEAKVEIIEPEENQPYVDIGAIPGNDKKKVKFQHDQPAI